MDEMEEFVSGIGDALEYHRFAPGGWVRLWHRFLPERYARELHDRLVDGLEWRQRNIQMFGRRIRQPRLTAWYGDPGITYTYSGTRWCARGWPEELAGLVPEVSRAAGEQFNSVLCNFYRDGNDSMGWHADDERALGKNPVIASLSLGQVRRFSLRRREASGEGPVHFHLASGSLLVMGGDLQHHWQHAVSKTRRPMGGRVNLTFRRIVD